MTDRLPLVVVSGWAMPSGLIDACLPEGRTVYRITPEQLLSPATTQPSEAIQNRLPELPASAIWVGWSLGGQLAMTAAAEAPERVAGVITLCASPRFVAGEDWPSAVEPAVFKDFCRRLQRSSGATLSHFCALMIHGSDAAGKDRRQLRRADWPALPDDWRLERTLTWLGELDQRALWQAPPRPARHLFGEADTLVPPEVAGELGVADERWRAVPGMAHWPGGHFAGEVRGILDNWCNQVTE